jgi:hypothetical protein
VLVGSYIGDMNAQLVTPRGDAAQGKAVLHVDRAEGVDCDHHLSELAVPAHRKIIFAPVERLGLKEGSGFLGDVKAVHEDFPFDLGGFVGLRKGGEYASFGRGLLVIPI